MSKAVEKFLETQISFSGTDEIVEKIHEEHKNLTLKHEKIETKQVEDVANKIVKSIFECKHPVVKKLIEWGWVGRMRSRTELKELVENLLINDVKSKEDLQKLVHAVECFKEDVRKGLKNKAERRQGDITHLQVPGSVAYQEARNLYYGERYAENALFSLSEQTMSSMCLGMNIAVYFANEELQEMLRRSLEIKFGSSHVLEENLKKLRIYRGVEDGRPYIAFIKFLLWFYEEYEKTEEDKKDDFRYILELLKETEGIIYFVPGQERERYSSVPIPRLDFFFSRWIDIEENRKTLIGLCNILYDFIRDVLKSAHRNRKERIAKEKLDLLMSCYDALFAQLLKFGTVNYEYVRKGIEFTIELSDQFNVPVSLYFTRRLLL